MKNNYITIKNRWFLMGVALLVSYSLLAQPPLKLQLLQPYYFCETGFIVFRTIGGDGTPISYMATHVTSTSPTSNTGVVEEAWRTNPTAGPITIQATQSDTTVALNFDINDFCAPPRFLYPVLKRPISDTILYVGDSTASIDLDNYFGTEGGIEYRTSFSYEAYGIPPGMTFTTVTGLPPGYAVIQGAPSVAGEYSVIVLATSKQGFNYAYSILDTFRITVLPTLSSSDNFFALTKPTYNCQTGAFTFNTSGGDNTLIKYYAAPGITGWTTNPNQFVDVETRTAPDAQPITLRARQNNKEVFYIWDIRTVCPVGNPDALRLVAPDYNCESGAFTFKTTGGDNSLVEFAAIGITGWTATPNQYVDTETRTAADAPPITLKARQSGQEVTYEWNIRAVCPLGSFRMGVAQEPSGDLQIKVLGNPVFNETLEIEILGAQDQSLRLQLFSEQGNKVSETVISSATSHQRSTLQTGSSSGIYLLRVSTPTQRQTVKVIK